MPPKKKVLETQRTLRPRAKVAHGVPKTTTKELPTNGKLAPAAKRAAPSTKGTAAPSTKTLVNESCAKKDLLASLAKPRNLRGSTTKSVVVPRGLLKDKNSPVARKSKANVSVETVNSKKENLNASNLNKLESQNDQIKSQPKRVSRRVEKKDESLLKITRRSTKDGVNKGTKKPTKIIIETKPVDAKNDENVASKDLPSKNVTKQKTRKKHSDSKDMTAQISPPKLRKRKTKIYVDGESSLDESLIEATIPPNNENVPIYKRIEIDNKKNNIKTDQYEFDSDTETVKTKRTRRRNDTSNFIPKSRAVKKRKKQKIKEDKKLVVRIERLSKAIMQRFSNNAPSIVPTMDTPLEELPPPIDEMTNEISHCFGFDRHESPTKIKILQNVLLSPQLHLPPGSPANFRRNEPNANSTMLHQVITPWRFHEMSIRRNPHLLQLKTSSSLPFMSQEMVLDHTLVDRLDCSRTPQRVPDTDGPKTPNPKQTFLTDFFSGNVKNRKENIAEISLFDDDKFSPIKRAATPATKGDLVRRSIFDVETKGIGPARRVLGEIHNNLQQVEVGGPRKEALSFGFEALEEEELVIRGKDAKPFRFSINENDRKYQRKVVPGKNVTFGRGWDSDKSDHSDKSEPSDEEDHSGEIRLFEDFDKCRETETDEFLQMPKMTKMRKKTKTKRRKDVRTKEEEEEAERWAASFNSMCEEVDRFPLEIE